MKTAKIHIGKLMRECGDIFTLATAVNVLGGTHSEVSKMLSRWTEQGWLTRMHRGIYCIVPLEAIDPHQVLENEWIVAQVLYEPCYIGGWSAAEYWDFTEQIFNHLCVLTERPIIHKKNEIHQISFFLTHIQKKINFGKKIIWKQEKKIAISDPHKTIIDMLYNPQWGGGIQHILDCFKAYIKSKHCDFNTLLAYAEQMNNGSIFKRLGFLSEKLMKEENSIRQFCAQHLSKGIAFLDPAIKEKNALITPWQLYVPQNLVCHL